MANNLIKFCKEKVSDKDSRHNFAKVLIINNNNYSATTFPDYFYLSLENDFNSFYKYWFYYCLDIINNPISDNKTYIYLNNVINKFSTNNFKFFIDFDCDLKYSEKNTDLIISILQKTIHLVEKLFTRNIKFVLWGRNLDKSQKYKFHIHFPDIIINKLSAINAINFIRDEIDLLYKNTTINFQKAFDENPYSNGIRLKGSYKIIYDKLNYNIIPDSNYLLYNLDDFKINILTIIPLEKKNSFEYLTAFKDSLISIDDDNQAITFSKTLKQIEDEMPFSLNYNNLNEQNNKDIISEIIETISKNYNYTCSFRSQTGNLLSFNTNGTHICPVNKDLTHERDNIYCIIKRNGIYIGCHRHCAPMVLLIEHDYSEQVLTSEFELNIIEKICKEQPDNRYALINYINRHFILINSSDITTYVELRYDPNNLIKINEISFRNGNDLSGKILSSKVFINGKEQKLFNIWNDSTKKKIYNGFAFYDNEIETNINNKLFNTFLGFAETRKNLREFFDNNKNSEEFINATQQIRSHILTFWAQNRIAYASWIIQWMAHIVQKPFVKTNVILGLTGEEGSGKSAMFENYFKPYFGKYYHLLQNASDFQWSAALAEKLLIFWNEANFDKETVGIIKHLTTEDSFRANEKNEKIRTVSNYSNIIIATQNSDEFKSAIAGREGRRFSIFGTVNLFTNYCLDDTIDVKILQTLAKKYYTQLFSYDWKIWISYLMFGVEISNINKDRMFNMPTPESTRLKYDFTSHIIRYIFNRTIEEEGKFNLYDTKIQYEDFIRGYETNYLGSKVSTTKKTILNNLEKLYPALECINEITLDPFSGSDKKEEYITFKGKKDFINVFCRLWKCDELTLSETISSIKKISNDYKQRVLRSKKFYNSLIEFFKLINENKIDGSNEEIENESDWIKNIYASSDEEVLKSIKDYSSDERYKTDYEISNEQQELDSLLDVYDKNIKFEDDGFNNNDHCSESESESDKKNIEDDGFNNDYNSESESDKKNIEKN